MEHTFSLFHLATAAFPLSQLLGEEMNMHREAFQKHLPVSISRGEELTIAFQSLGIGSLPHCKKQCLPPFPFPCL